MTRRPFRIKSSLQPRVRNAVATLVTPNFDAIHSLGMTVVSMLGPILRGLFVVYGT